MIPARKLFGMVVGIHNVLRTHQKTFTTHLDCEETKMATTFQGA